MPQAERTVRLVVVGSRSGGTREAALPLTIGRSAEADWQIPSLEVSRMHCRLDWGDDGFVRVRDLESKNGTFVGDQLVHPDRPLWIPPGELLTVGPITIRVEYEIKAMGSSSEGAPLSEDPSS